MRPRCIGRQSRGARLGLRLTTPLLALVAVTAVWGVTFVQVKDAVEIYPILPFLAVRFGIASAVLAPAAPRVRGLGRRGAAGAALAGALLGAGYVLQTLGLERTSVSGAGFGPGMYVVLTPLVALVLFRLQGGGSAWRGVGLATAGLAVLDGIHGGPAPGARRRSDARAARPPTESGVTVILLALAAAVTFGAMTVAISFGLQGGNAATGALAMLLSATAVAAVAALPRHDFHRSWEFLLAG